jgi:predicted metalloprotease with PDZ domain
LLLSEKTRDFDSNDMKYPRRAALLTIIVFAAAAASWSQSRITLSVDASEAAGDIIHVSEKMTVRPGKFDLFYPKWIPGEHAPTGPLNNMVNLHITANGKPVAWQRDDVEMFAIHCDIPAGVTSVDITFDDAEQPGSTASASLARIKWNRLLLYPRGHLQTAITVAASLKMPDGWQFATALPVVKQAGDTAEFGPVTLEHFIDSPAIIGENFKRVPLTESGVKHEIDIAADTPEALQYKPETLTGWKNLVIQANRMFGAHHYNSYKFLLTLSDVGGDEGLEHHESSEDGTGLNALTDAEELLDLDDLLSHEYVHSWNGKYRRPATLATPDFERPMYGELLWVYEGLTEHLGNVLPPRSGLWTPEDFRETMADVAAQVQMRSGRKWRPLADTARAVQFTYSGPHSWQNERRGADYYYEGQMIWLEVDVVIRRRSGDKHSLDDFLRAFHGGRDSAPAVVPYTFADVVAALNKVQPYDWAGFFRQRIYAVAPEAPLGGIDGSGWKLEYNDAPNERIAGREKRHKFRDLMYSIGLNVAEDGTISDVQPDLPAAMAGISPGMTLVGRDDKEFSLDDLVKMVADSRTNSAAIALDVDNGGVERTVTLDYHGGLRYPHLVRDASKPDILSDIIKPR